MWKKASQELFCEFKTANVSILLGNGVVNTFKKENISYRKYNFEHVTFIILLFTQKASNITYLHIKENKWINQLMNETQPIKKITQVPLLPYLVCLS